MILENIDSPLDQLSLHDTHHLCNNEFHELFVPPFNGFQTLSLLFE